MERFSRTLQGPLAALVADWPESERIAAGALLAGLTESLNAVPAPEPEPAARVLPAN